MAAPADLSILKDIVIIFGLAVGTTLLFHRLKLPSLLGFILTGIIAGPNGLGIVEQTEQVKLLAEIGVVLLLFAIGMEFSLENLARIKRILFVAGPIQVIATALAAFGVAVLANAPVPRAIFYGFLVSLSSTVIVLRLLQDRGQVDKPNGQLAIGMTIFQDLAAIPMLLLVPLLADNGNDSMQYELIALGLGIVILGLVMVASQLLVPRLLYQIARTRSRELFLLCVLVICFAVAWTASLVGISLALGAFLAGLVISRSEYSHNAIGNILPFRDVFSSFFFVSIGMLFDVQTLLDKPLLILLLTLAVLCGKSLISSLGPIALGYPIRTSIVAGLTLAQVGEFSFILAQSGMAASLMGEESYQLFLAVSILTMIASPFLVANGERLARWGEKMPMPDRLRAGWRAPAQTAIQTLQDHLVIIGYGLNGRNLVRSAKSAGVPYAIVEINPDTVRTEQAAGEPIVFGDACHAAVLQSVRVTDARVVAVVIDNPEATRRIIETVRELSPSVYLIVRTRYLKEMPAMLAIGANDVIPEEFETSVEIFTRVLRQYLIPKKTIEQFAADVRADHYQILRQPVFDPILDRTSKLQLSDFEIDWLEVAPGSAVDRKTLAQLELRNRFGLTVLLIRRGEKELQHPSPHEALQAGDIVFVLGKPEDVAKAHGEFSLPATA